MVKYCSKCERELEELMFGKNSVREDGLQSYCRECMKAYSAGRRLVPKDWPRKTADKNAYGRAYYAKNLEKMRCREKAKYEARMKRIHGELWVKRVVEKAVVRKKTIAAPLTPEDRRWRRCVNERVRKAVLSGQLVRLPCEVCGDMDVEGHHSDYDQPLSVVWLCKTHHFDVHHN
jgi:hypothetical protein